MHWSRTAIAALTAACIGAVAFAATSPSPSPLLADATANAGQQVDVELIIAVDISYSMDPDELAIQREGYAQAINSPEFLSARGIRSRCLHCRRIRSPMPKRWGSRMCARGYAPATARC